ncbi:TIGR01244 family sulfur transferase [Albirhodobacter sp. R86504]|uniref:TIGR01244 family sulfur transferase n=1 Tax=Albirhodobacter sp. R86504 TaxID=3093848 RepID=UPI00366A55C6
MDLRQITPDFAVAPQIETEDLQALANAGYRAVICNRPDDEVGGDLNSQMMSQHAAEAGLAFHYLPYYPGAMTPELVAEFETALATIDGPVFAYCRSGTRSSHLWAMSQAGHRPTQEILSLAAEAGYDNRAMAGLLESHGAQRSAK